MSRTAIRLTTILILMLSGFLTSACVPESGVVQMSTHTIDANVNLNTTPTPAGGGAGKIVFSSYRVGESGIFTMSADGSGLTQLTDDSARLNQPTWSLDGSYIAYVRREWPTNLEIYVMKADGSDQIRLTHNFHSYDIEPDWSPDGMQIAFASSQYGYLDIFTIKLDDFQQTRLTENWGIDSSPDWSPNGEKIVYRSELNQNNEIFIMNADGSGKSNLTNHPASDTDPAWSPDGSMIAFVSDREGFEDIYVMNADGSNPIRLTDSMAKDTYPAWSPDGRLIAFYSDRRGNFEIYVMNADGSNQIAITNHGDFDGFPDWEPHPSAIQTVSIHPLYSVDPEIINWLRQNAILIPSITPRAGYDDLLSLKQVFEEARVVALGEAALGTVESIRMKHLLVEFLISEFGFNKIILAMDWETANRINQSIQTYNGDLEQILAGLDHASWSTVEMVDLVNMVQSYSQDHGTAQRPIIITGYHNITPELPMDQVIEFLEGVDPTAAEEAEERYNCFRRYEPNWFMYSGASHDQKLECSDDLKSVYEDLIAHQDEYEAMSTSEEFLFAFLSTQLMAHFEEPYRIEDLELERISHIRNTGESIQWLMEQGRKDDKVILWADNISIADVDSALPTEFPLGLGHYLKDSYGDEMLSIGFAFNAGRVNARAFGMGNPILPQEVLPPPEGSFDWVAHNLGWPAFLLDLRGIDLNHPGAVWLNQSLYLHDIGEYYHEDDPESYLTQFHLPTAFDAIIYIDEVTPSHLLPPTEE
jgi:Tol biopolymer transport system component/erythromycin esterase-like protein